MLSTIWHLSPEGWTAIATWVGACVAVAVGIAAATVGNRQLSEARRLRREQAQPYVVVFTDSSGGDPRHLDLVIKNVGKTAATNVRMVFSAPLESAVLRGHPNHSPVKTPARIPVLVPDQEWRTFWDFTPARDEAKDLPEHYTATVTFDDSQGQTVGSYTFEIDWRVLIDRGFITVYNLHDVATALREISEVLRRVKSHDGLDVVVRDGDAIDERRRQHYEEKGRQEANGVTGPQDAQPGNEEGTAR